MRIWFSLLAIIVSLGLVPALAAEEPLLKSNWGSLPQGPVKSAADMDEATTGGRWKLANPAALRVEPASDKGHVLAMDRGRYDLALALDKPANCERGLTVTLNLRVQRNGIKHPNILRFQDEAGGNLLSLRLYSAESQDDAKLQVFDPATPGWKNLAKIRFHSAEAPAESDMDRVTVLLQAESFRVLVNGDPTGDPMPYESKGNQLATLQFAGEGDNSGLWLASLSADPGAGEPFTVPSTTSASPRPGLPNFLFVFGDDINRDSLPIYGGTNIQTPHIDRLAADGIVFENAYTNTPMCAPFRQELYSGRNVWRTRTLMNHSWTVPDPGTKDPEKAEARSIPTVLKDLGYRVALAGKRHYGPRETYPFEYLGDFKTNDEAMALIEPFVKESAAEARPFCLFVASHDGHLPYNTVSPAGIVPPEKVRVDPQWLDTPEFRDELRLHFAEIENLDKLVGRLDNLLEQTGSAENTLVMFSSEQGSSYPYAKWTCYVDGVGTALVARWPGRIPPGQRWDGLVMMTDVAPTFLEAAGGTPRPGDYDGFSLLPVFAGSREPLRDYVFAQATNKGLNRARDVIYPIRSIRNKDFSLIWNPNAEKGVTYNAPSYFAYTLYSSGGKAKIPAGEESSPAVSMVRRFFLVEDPDQKAADSVRRIFQRPEWEFYDLRNDPSELDNRIDDPAHADTIASMRKELMAFLEAHGDADPMATEKTLTTNKPEEEGKGKRQADDPES